MEQLRIVMLAPLAVSDRRGLPFSNQSSISLMQRLCEDVEAHMHEPWGYSPEQGLATAMEAQYPNGMCEQLVRVLMKFVWKKDSECSPLTTNLHVRQTTAWQGHSTADSEDEKVAVFF